jgi:hypothetical protein
MPGEKFVPKVIDSGIIDASTPDGEHRFRIEFHRTDVGLTDIHCQANTPEARDAGRRTAEANFGKVVCITEESEPRSATSGWKRIFEAETTDSDGTKMSRWEKAFSNKDKVGQAG